MTSIAESQTPFLSTLDADQVRKVLLTLGPDLKCYANSDVKMNGNELCRLLSSSDVKKSRYKGIGGGLERSMLAKEVRKLTGELFEPNLRAMFAPKQPAFQSSPPGDLSNPKWSTLSSAGCSLDGATGVIFVNTESGGYVVKASDAPAREMFATELALKLGLPAAKQHCCSKVERRDIIKRLSTLSHQAAVNQHTGATGDTNGMLAIHLKLWSVFNQRPWVTAIELVPGASLMCGMATDQAEIQLNSSTEKGVSRLTQIGQLICLDAFLNNNDRIPVVHSNVGNGRNVMFSNGLNGDIVAIDQVVTCFDCTLEKSFNEWTTNVSETKTDTDTTTTNSEQDEESEHQQQDKKQKLNATKRSIYDDCKQACKLRAENGTLDEQGHHNACSHKNDTSFTTSTSSSTSSTSSTTTSSLSTSSSSMANVTSKLYSEYMNRVNNWLRQCLTYEHANDQQKNYLRTTSIHEELSTVPLLLVNEIKVKYNISERDAEAVVRCAGFERGTAFMIAETPLMFAYAQKRGPRVVQDGSLLGVRDFIVRQTAFDVGEKGVEKIRDGVCTCARRIAALNYDDLLALRENVANMMQPSELKDDSPMEWNRLVHDVVNMNYLKEMHGLVFNAIQDINPTPQQPALSVLRTSSGNEVYTDEITGRLYKHNVTTGKTSWCEEGEMEK